MKKKEQKALDQIMDWFDFEKVAKTMEEQNDPNFNSKKTYW